MTLKLGSTLFSSHLLGSYTPVSIPNSLSTLTNMIIIKPTNMNLHHTHKHKARTVPQPPMYCTVCMLCLRSLCYHEPCTFPVSRLLWLQNHNKCHFLLNCIQQKTCNKLVISSCPIDLLSHFMPEGRHNVDAALKTALLQTHFHQDCNML